MGLSTIIEGMGELHLEIIVVRMRREFGVVANVGTPRVAYRETIRRTTEQEGKYIRQSGGFCSTSKATNNGFSSL